MGVAQFAPINFEQTTYISKGEFPTRSATSDEVRARTVAL